MSFVVVLILILGVGVFFLSAFIVRMVSAPRQSKAIAEALKQGRSNVVVRSAKALLQKDPRNAPAHWYLAQAYLAEGKPELSLMELKAVSQIGQFGLEVPETDFRMRIAALYERFNQIDQASGEYILLTKLEPRVAVHFMDAGRLFEARGKTDLAVNYLRKAIEMDERLHVAHHILGLILYRTKHPMEAKTELEAAIKWNPDDFEAYYYVGKVLKEMSDFTAALLSFEKAGRSQELRLKCFVERGGCYMSQGSLDKAVSELERAVKQIKDEGAPESLYGRYFLALCYEKSRSLDQAIEQWERIYSKKPGFRDVAEKLTQYQEYRTDDHIKDYLTCGKEEFAEICKSAVVMSLGLSIRDCTDIPNGVDIIAVEGESEKWMSAKKIPTLVRFLRVSDNLDEGSVRSLLDQMKKLGIVRGSIVTSSAFSRAALEFAENRSVELLTKDKLQEMLAKTSPAKRR
jgi:tetratricopeptide (TPR) repeat protein